MNQRVPPARGRREDDCLPDGRILGSIGGGCSEAAVLGEARSLIGSGRYKVVHVDLTGEAAEDEGMVCGGIMDVLVEDFATDREPCDR